MGEQNRSVACVARELGVGWSSVMAAVVDYGTVLVDDPRRTAAVHALGIDEVSYCGPTPGATLLDRLLHHAVVIVTKGTQTVIA